MKTKRARGSHRRRSSSKPNHTLHRQPLGSQLRLNGFEHVEPRLLLSGETLLGDSVADLDLYQYENTRIDSVASANAVSMLASASAAASTHTFRVDSGWELDSHQHRDNPIHFYVNVHDIDVSAIQSATMTLAVWDVDFNGPYPPERDEVYINNHRLTTPQAYLTGANSQWSTVTFNVEPGWIVDGNNRVDIIIDVLTTFGRRWAVECDWAELQVEVQNPEITEIRVSSNTPSYNVPVTMEEVKLEAVVDNAQGINFKEIYWEISDAATGSTEYRERKQIDGTSTDDFVLEHTPAAGTHGNK